MDAYAAWDYTYRLKVRVVTTRAYHALFMQNMLIRPSQEELDNFGEPDFVIYNAGQVRNNKLVGGLASHASAQGPCFAHAWPAAALNRVLWPLPAGIIN